MILDTCAMLWLAESGGRLSQRTLKAIGEAPEVRVVAISGFEIARKVFAGKLRLSKSVDAWFVEVVAHCGLTLIPLDLQICLKAAALPSLHDDPADRFIIAAAKIHDCLVVTSDERFPQYGIHTII